MRLLRQSCPSVKVSQSKSHRSISKRVGGLRLPICTEILRLASAVIAVLGILASCTCLHGVARASPDVSSLEEGGPRPTTRDTASPGADRRVNASSAGSVLRAGRTENANEGFDATFARVPFSEASDGFDPVIVHKRHFEDDQYRLIFKDDPFGDDKTELWKTPDFSDWKKVSGSIAGDADQFEDHIVLSDGTFVLYQSPTQDGGTSIWTGKDLANIKRRGTVVPEPDGGVYYDREAGVVHIYTEDQDNTSGAGSDKLSHWTTPEGDLLEATQQEDAIDLTGRPWHTGDPDIIEISGTYYMLTDRTTDHPNYRIAVFRSDDLSKWTLLQGNINPDRSTGDMNLVRYDGAFVGFGEYDNYAEDQDPGIGQWDVNFTQPTLRIVANRNLTLRQSETKTIPEDFLRAHRLGARPSHIKYRIVEGPSEGRLTVGGMPADTFAQRDVREGEVAYNHDGSPGRDAFVFEVSAFPGETVRDTFSTQVRMDFRIAEVAPQPARTRVRVQYSIPRRDRGPSRLALYDVLGRKVWSAEASSRPGRHTRQVNVSGLSSGTYMLRLSVGGRSTSRRITVVR